MYFLRLILDKSIFLFNIYVEEVISMKYGYVRVSTAQQHIDRQIDSLLKMGLDKNSIYIDCESGKDFNRKNYKKLIRKLKKDDLLIIKSIDRLGRNYNTIIEEWRLITKSKGANIVVIDMPLLDTRIDGKNLVSKLISDIVLQVLSFVAQNERETLHIRQAEGIKAAKARGVKFGRPRISLPFNYKVVAKQYLNKEITNKKACDILGMTRGSFFRYLKEMNINSTNKTKT